jgi:hypothetical protein
MVRAQTSTDAVSTQPRSKCPAFSFSSGRHHAKNGEPRFLPPSMVDRGIYIDTGGANPNSKVPTSPLAEGANGWAW